MKKELAEIYNELNAEGNIYRKQTSEIEFMNLLSYEIKDLKNNIEKQEKLGVSVLMADKKDYLSKIEDTLSQFQKIYPKGFDPSKGFDSSVSMFVDKYLELMSKPETKGKYDVLVEFRPAYDGSDKTFRRVIEDLKKDAVDIELLHHRTIEKVNDSRTWTGVYYVGLRSSEYGKFIEKYNELSDKGSIISPSEELIGRRDIYFIPPMLNKQFTVEDVRNLVIKGDSDKDNFFRPNVLGLGYIEVNGVRSDPKAILPYMERAFSEMFVPESYAYSSKNFFNCNYVYNSKGNKDYIDKPVTVIHELEIFNKEQLKNKKKSTLN